MIVSELHLLIFLLIITIVNAMIGRCYLCSQDILGECVGSNQPDSSIYTNVLKYYTEPCNGQCVLFRKENRSIVRGCSWTYGHMTLKTIGWHEISPGIKAYFCNSHLCNNGTYEQPEISIMRTAMINNQLILSSEQYFPKSLHQCYSCTARFQGCGEFLDPHYASKYIRSCPTSCIIFRNPNDLNLITRDCSMFWPQAHIKNGLHKLLGSDAFFCQESLCNGISFDFIMGILYNQFPAVIKFSTHKTIPTTTSATTIKTTINIYNDNAIWDDPDLDFAVFESTTPVVSNNLTTSIPIDHFDLTDEIDSSDDVTIVQSNSSLNWFNLNDTSISLSSTLIPSTIQMKENNWTILNTSSVLPITRFEHLSVDDDSIEQLNETTKNIELNSEINLDTDDYILSPTLTTTIPIINSTIEYVKPLSTLAMPPFSWTLNISTNNTSIFLNSTTATTTTIKTSDTIYEYCKNKQCYHHGRLNSDCLCICLPTFTGDNCETVVCEDEPTDICAFILEHECQTNHIQYLCPKFCQLDACFSKEI